MDVHTISDSLNKSEALKCFKKLPFSSSERELIVALVQDRPIIEDKRTHAKNIELKKQAWEELTVAFNAQPYVSQRKTVQLKRCWENIKSQRKKELSQEFNHMKRTGGGPPQSGSSSDNIVDAICPYINLTVPGVIDSNSIEISEDPCSSLTNPDDISKEIFEIKQTENVTKINDEAESIPSLQLKRKFRNEIVNTPKSTRGIKLESEMEARKKWCIMNISHDQALHELRVKREEILIERERNMVEYEKEIHKLQIEKLKLEIDKLRNINYN